KNTLHYSTFLILLVFQFHHFYGGDVKLKLPKNDGIERLVISGMLNSEECFYDAISYLEQDYFTSNTTINLFNKLKDDNEMQSSQLLISKTDNMQMKDEIREIDSMWSG